MWKSATDWRESFGVGHRVMGRFGTGATYAVRGGGLAVSPPYPPDGVSGDGIAGGAGSKTFCAVGGVSNCSSSSSSNQTAKEKKAGATEADKALEAFGAAVGGAVGVTSTAGTWAWQRNQSQNGHTTTANDTLEGFAEETCFYGRLKKDDPRDGAPVAVWRLGVVDWSGVAREGAQTEVTDGFVSHLEDVLQAGRAASIERKHLVRARLIIDGTGLGIGTLAHLNLIKSITSMGKAYFPETTASATVVNAPWIFARVWGVFSPLLTEMMRRKVCILDENFASNGAAAFEAHCGLKVSELPRFLGGDVPDDQCPRPVPVPRGFASRLAEMRGERERGGGSGRQVK